MNSTYSSEQRSNTGCFEADVILCKFRLNQLSRLMKIKSTI